MVAADCSRCVPFLVPIWAASLLVLQTTVLQGTDAINPISSNVTGQISYHYWAEGPRGIRCSRVVSFGDRQSSTNVARRPENGLDKVYSSHFFYQQSEYPRDCKEVFDRCSSGNFSGAYFIKPDGLSVPFEAHCDNVDGLSGWTVIHRREFGGIVDFDRDWSSYRNGFGFLSREFWIGNEKLSYLTNQKNYQMVIEMALTDGSTVRVSYNNFRIGDEFSGYKIFIVTHYSGDTDSVSWCPSNMVYDDCTCGRKLCGDPEACLNTCTGGRSEGCICPAGFVIESGACVPERECGCFISEEQTVIPEGETYVNNDCTRIATCSNGQLTRNERYECSPDAACGERDGERRCYCNEGLIGNGETCEPTYTDCVDAYTAGSRSSGVYSIKPRDWPGTPFSVYCNMTDGGGWTVFQRRIDGDVDFFLYWDDYKQGFGDVDDEHWLGNEQLYYLTNQKNYQLKVDLVNSNGNPYYAKFSSFRINNEADKYRLAVNGYSGTAGGGYMNHHNGYQFSTRDRDNDGHSYHCAERFHGAWWFHYNCHHNDLNGDYDGSEWNSICWYYLPGDYYNIKYTEMKIRPV